MGTVDYLELLRKLTETGSDYAVARLLGISENAVNGYRTGKRAMSPDVALLIAEKLNLPPLQVIADAQIEHAKNPAMRAKWVRLRKTYAQLAAVVTIALCAAMIPRDGEATIGAWTNDLGSGPLRHRDALTIMRRLRRASLRLARATIDAVRSITPPPLGLAPEGAVRCL